MGGMIHFLEMVRTPVGAVVGLVVVVLFVIYLKWLLTDPPEDE
ncbi:MAG: hypothetical protein OXI88_12465 [Gammaproteobacteria bacterium]|nr:hypothetical protein [Gammaproteobacteria bacterium]MDE0512588.1 hypothetical protein [Gammaproteobacteria bacterium]